MHDSSTHQKSQFLHAIAQCQLALFRDISNPLTGIQCADNFDCDTVADVNLVPSIVERDTSKSKELNKYLLFKKHNLNSKKCKNIMLIKRIQMQQKIKLQ